MNHADIIEIIKDRGYFIIENLMPHEKLDACRAVLDPVFEGQRTGRNQFEGFKTQRIYSLPKYGPALWPFFDNEDVLKIIKPLLWGDCLITAALAANVLPGEQPQAFHTDDSFYPIPRPRPAFSVGAIWAMDDFTAENGATQLIPYSHTWGDDEKPEGVLETYDAFQIHEAGQADGWAAPKNAEIVTAEMPRGSVLIFLGNLWHRAGGNVTDHGRLGLFPQYCATWARQQENFFLSIPREDVAKMPETMQSLLGYQIHPPFMGHAGGRHPAKLLAD
ncbi:MULTISPECIES: phytanoyl-CoA dioxygenase family protein [Kordiimonas]|jgi:ectoine hydroxylase-related dioxygenase (phytanoyl-CoA dioxygenase family)|uniref:phytanoyl-CoA dioxygenase family protein n=1 Tax=Kordiimonas TaxID=288021 RepID=UPI00257A0888|nr:phytanoyl-CoA dioxygenase family protein [Kordiimonas sp. UBA4487]